MRTRVHFQTIESDVGSSGFSVEEIQTRSKEVPIPQMRQQLVDRDFTSLLAEGFKVSDENFSSWVIVFQPVVVVKQCKREAVEVVGSP